MARGMQCHIGSKYGEKMKILVASLDCGYGGANIIEERTSDVVEGSKKPLNPHMRGTYKALSLFLDETDPKELVNYMIMTNTCKCCYWDSPNHLDIEYYMNCGYYAVEEVYRIQPDAVLFQGKNAPAYSLANHFLRPINDSKQEHLKEELMFFEYKDFKCYAVLCIHPSARGRSARKKIDFYDNKLPLIAEYIREHPLK